jgi:hypothetical protein
MDGAPSNGFPESALDSVSDNGVSNAFTYHESEPAVVKPVGEVANHQQPVGGADSFAVNLGMPFVARNAVPSLHDEAPLVTRLTCAGP